ncbi:LytR C-terminal domain-containing protein [Massilia sp. SM-13]|uniref:LytR C-terminal domain-containing protein n=1 Tax=Pseudoduganella rhizocola TaxID=3382643 RepID=UPI0038B57CAA
MRPSLTLIALACTALVSCSMLKQKAAPPAVASADAYYALGRGYHAEAKPQDAQRAYLLALQRDPRHADARNGMAVLLAERGEAAQAIAIWRKLADETLPPRDRALVLGNLGNALARHGDKEEALYLLQKAAVLDPANADNWERLGAALQSAGEPEQAAVMQRQADSLRQHDIKADYALVARTASSAAASAPTPAPALALAPPPALTLVPVPMPAPAPALALALPPVLTLAPVPMPAPVPGAAPGPTLALHLEISNGNGVRGMAADWARKLRGGAWKSLRVTNSRPFVVARTRVEFAPQREAAARELAQRIGGAALQEVKTMTDLRVVLGHDQRPQKEMPAQGGHRAP